MTSHQTFKEMLARRTELSPREETLLRLHLADCAECRDRADDYALQTTLLRTISPAEPPAVLRAGVLAAIRRSPVSATPFWWRPVAFVPLAAALLVAGVGLAALHGLPTEHRAATGALTSVRTTPQLIPRGTSSFSAQGTVPRPRRRVAPARSSTRHVPPSTPTVAAYTAGGTVARNEAPPPNQPTAGLAFVPGPTPTPIPAAIHAAGAPPPGSRQPANGQDAATRAKKAAPIHGPSADNGAALAPAATPKPASPVIPAAPSVQPAPPSTLPVATVAFVPTPVPFVTPPVASLAAPMRPTATASPTATPPPTPAPMGVPFAGSVATPTPTP